MLREKFEAWISTPPYEKSLTRNYPAWPGQYNDYAVQLAWEATGVAYAIALDDAIAAVRACTPPGILTHSSYDRMAKAIEALKQ